MKRQAPSHTPIKKGRSSAACSHLDLQKSVEDAVSDAGGTYLLIIQVYSKSQAQVDLLNRTAKYFFAKCQRALLEHFLLTTCRVGDKANSAGKDTVSLLSLINSCGALGDPAKRKLRRVVKSQRAENIKYHRDKILAHADQDVLKGSSIPPKMVLNDVKRVLDDFARVINVIRTAHGDSTLESSNPLLDVGDGNRLMHLLAQVDQKT